MVVVHALTGVLTIMSTELVTLLSIPVIIEVDVTVFKRQFDASTDLNQVVFVVQEAGGVLTIRLTVVVTFLSELVAT